MCNYVMIDSIGHEIKAINHVMQRQMLKSASDAGVDKVTLMHGWIIGYLHKNRDHDIYQKDIESKFAISRSTVTNIVKCMEKKGYIERVSVNSDARLKKLILTDRGEEINSVIMQAIKENERRFDSVLTDEERQTFFELIRKLRNGLENN